MTRVSRSTLLTAGAVLVVLGGLVVAGRWSQGRLEREADPVPPTRPPATTTVAPNGVVARIGDAGPVEDVAVGRDAVWAAASGTVTRFDPATGRPTGWRPPCPSRAWGSGPAALPSPRERSG